MSDKSPPPLQATHHAVVAHAGPGDEMFRSALAGIELPALGALFSRLSPDAPEPVAEDALSPSHERALARAMGLAGPGGAPVIDGLIPWAAAEALTRGLAGHEPGWAFITPCHWQVGMNEVVQHDPADLALGAGEARTLMDAMAPWFAEDGLALQDGPAPGVWLVQGDLLAGMPTASLDRVIGRSIGIEKLGTYAARPLRRLQQEMQMLLYTHPLNDAREQRRAQPVNSFWISGTGTLPAGWHTPRTASALLIDKLTQPALRGDTAGWREAWKAVDAQLAEGLLAAARAGENVALTLCGEHASQTWRSAPLGLMQRVRRRLSPVRMDAVLGAL